MVRTVAWFQNQCALNSREPMQAILSGLRYHGLTIVENAYDADAAIIWSVLWAGRMRMNQAVYRHYRDQGKPVICVDVGALRRNYTWKIAVNHVTAEGYYGHNDNIDLDRARRLGLELSSPTDNNGIICIAGQHKDSLQMQDWPSVEDWINDRIQAIKKYTDRPIHIRPHPRSPINSSKLVSGAIVVSPKKINNTYDDFDIQYNYHALVNHNSGPGIQAAIAGCRPIVSASSLAAPVAHDIVNIDAPYAKDRDTWLHNIAHTEWTVEELATGNWYTRLLPAL